MSDEHASPNPVSPIDHIPSRPEVNPERQSLQTQNLSTFGRLLVGALTLTTVGIIIWAFYRGYDFLDKLSDPNYARGLITFIVALTTVSIAFSLILSALMDGSDRTKEAFSRGKEILTILVGIFGTCLGFYFSATTPTPTLEIAKPSVIVTEKNVLLTTFAKGGKPPYTYSIVFDEGTLQNAIGSSETGLVQETIPLTTTSTGDVGYTLKVADSQLLIKDFVATGENKIKVKLPISTPTPTP